MAHILVEFRRKVILKLISTNIALNQVIGLSFGFVIRKQILFELNVVRHVFAEHFFVFIFVFRVFFLSSEPKATAICEAMLLICQWHYSHYYR